MAAELTIAGSYPRWAVAVRTARRAARAASGAAYVVPAWSALVEIVGGVGSSRGLLDTSVFHQMAPAPATRPDWASVAALLGVAAAAVAVGAVGFRRRDLPGV